MSFDDEMTYRSLNVERFVVQKSSYLLVHTVRTGIALNTVSVRLCILTYTQSITELLYLASTVYNMDLGLSSSLACVCVHSE